MNEQITIHLDNLTEEEREQFTKLLSKASEEPSKESRVWKPENNEEYYFINDFATADTDIWGDSHVDHKRFEIGNVYKTREEVCFALERAKVKAELKRYALEHNDPEKEAWDLKNRHFGLTLKHDTKDIGQTDLKIFQDESATCFTSAPIARDAIEAVGRERILKYIFGVEVEE